MKVWDLHMESKPIETFTVHEYLRSKLCSLYENDCIFDKFEVAIFTLISANTNCFSQCCWNGTDSAIMTGSYNNFFRCVLTWRSSFHLGSPPKISVWMPFNSDKSALMFFSAGCLIEAPARK